MPRKNSYLTLTDQFCGAGGSSQGVRNFARKTGNSGLEIKLALNHWKLAIETHNTNFPDTIHDCTDVSAADPRRYPSTDILITSPECTNHSLAKGVASVKKQMDLFKSGKLDPAAERSRATMWDVPRFAEYHNYNAIIVENVVDARKWIMFDAWLHAMYALGYVHKCVYLNSMHAHPTPQSRDRMYVVFWKKGNKTPNLEYTPAAYCPKCGVNVRGVQTWKRPDVRWGKYRQQYVYSCPACGTVVEPYFYAAFNCIDWTDPGQRIGDRAKKLSPKTVTRIEYGINKYGKHPFQVVNYTPGYTRPMTDTTATITCQDHNAVCMPMIVASRHTSGISDRVKSIAESQMGTQPGDVGHGICTPFIVNRLHGGHPRVGPLVKSCESPLSTQSTLPGLGIVMPIFLKAEHGNAENVRPGDGILQTQTTRQSMSVVVPFIAELRGTGKAKSATDPLCCVTAGGNNHGLVQAPFLTISRGKSMAGDALRPINTVSGGGIHTGIITGESFNSFIAAYYSRGHSLAHITDELGSITTSDRMAVVNYQTPKVDDCYYRMLKAPEVQLAMAFDRDYVVLGNSRDKVKQLGNAVTPPAMEWLIGQIYESFN